jgi:hypothetical protein
LGSTDLNPEMAPCWRFVWNVEPAALMVPLAVLVLDEALALVAAELAAAELAAAEDDDDELEDEHAARASAATTAPLTVATCFLPRNCINGISL